MAYYAVWMKPANQELAPVYLEAHIEYLSQLRLEGKVSGNGRLLNGPAGVDSLFIEVIPQTKCKR